MDEDVAINEHCFLHSKHFRLSTHHLPSVYAHTQVY